MKFASITISLLAIQAFPIGEFISFALNVLYAIFHIHTHP